MSKFNRLPGRLLKKKEETQQEQIQSSQENVRRVVDDLRQNDTGQKRHDYKGKRVSLTIRVPEKLKDDLSYLSILTEQAQNDFCTDVLLRATQRHIREQEQELTSEELFFYKETFRRKKRKK